MPAEFDAQDGRDILNAFTRIKGSELPEIKVSLLPPKTEITGERYYVTSYRCLER